jgi:hypothetical protein
LFQACGRGHDAAFKNRGVLEALKGKGRRTIVVSQNNLNIVICFYRNCNDQLVLEMNCFRHFSIVGSKMKEERDSSGTVASEWPPQ